jgi:acyl-CoA synthetase (NDP forming)
MRAQASPVRTRLRGGAMRSGGTEPAARRLEMRNLDRFFNPRSIAIVGASEDFSKINGRPLKFLLDKGYDGRIYPINPKYETLAGLRCYPNVAAVGAPIDLAIVAVPAAHAKAAVEGCARAGVGGVVVFSSGYAETGEEGRARERELAEAARRAGVPLCGPNTLGFWNAFARVMATFSQAADGEVSPGEVAFVTQSGAFGTAIVALARERGISLGYFVNSGNEADLRFAELVRYVVRDPRVRVVAGYIEGLKDGAELLEAAEEARSLGKPLIVVKVGRYAAGARAALSHTGSLAGSDRVWTGVFRQKAIVRAYDVDELLDAIDAFRLAPLPAGRRIGIVTQSGGAGVLMADRAEELGLEVAQLTEATKTALRGVIPAFGATGNPIDVTAQFIAEPRLLREALALVLRDPNVDVAVFYLGLMERAVDAVVENLRAALGDCGKPLLVGWAAAPASAREKLRAAGICMLPGATRAVEAASLLAAYAEASRRPRTTVGDAAPIRVDPGRGAWAARDGFDLLQRSGIAVAPWRFARDADEAVRAARELGFPVALKIESGAIAHKTEAGGVRLHLQTESAVRAAFAEVTASARAYAPQAALDGVVVQSMIDDGVEAIVGVQRDPQLGPLVMVGLGGIFVEVFEDISFRVAPLCRADALEMLRELRGYRLLEGFRGRPPADVDALVDLILAVSRLAIGTADAIAEIDLNPVKVRAAGRGAIAVDALVVGRVGAEPNRSVPV